MNEKELEQNTQDSVDIAQAFEFAIMLLLLNEFEKVAKGGNQAESTNTIRKEAAKEVDTFKKSLEVGILATLKNILIDEDIKEEDEENELPSELKESLNNINNNAKKYFEITNKNSENNKNTKLGNKIVDKVSVNQIKKQGKSIETRIEKEQER